jgi:hypothetical protein
VGGKWTLQPPAKNNFCNPTTPDNNQNEAAVVGFMGERRRQMIASRNARFMVVPTMWVDSCMGEYNHIKIRFICSIVEHPDDAATKVD